MRLLTETVFVLAQRCSDRIRELGLEPGTGPGASAGRSGFGDYLPDIVELSGVWNGQVSNGHLYEWDVQNGDTVSFSLASYEGSDTTWRGPAGYRFSESDHWRLEECFRYISFMLDCSRVENETPMVDDYWYTYRMGVMPLMEYEARMYIELYPEPGEEFEDSFERLQVAFFDTTDPLWRTNGRRF